MLLFLGKGGAGKTTLAAASGLRLAQAGERVLIASVDQAHSLADAFAGDAEVEDSSRVRSIAPGLDILEIDTLRLLEARYRGLGSLLAVASAGHEHGVSFGAIEPEELLGLPGVEELLGMHEISRLADENRWDTVIVDLPASADALRTLQLPDTVAAYVERIWPLHARIVAGTGSDVRLTLVVAMIERILAQIDSVRSLIADADRTGATVVVTAEQLSIVDAERTLSAAALLGIRIDRVLVNRILPKLNASSVGLVGAHPAVFWFERWRAAQLDAVAELRRRIGTVPIVEVEQAPGEPVGLRPLQDVADRLEPDSLERRAPGWGEQPSVVLESGGGLESVYAMRMLLPVVDSTTLGLGRVEDDLIVSADGRRRRIRLASVLRRCVADSAELDGPCLVVRFRPNPDVWPL
ncbi:MULTISPECIES: ArsA family ATPase [unclassified Rhodococcus (in: high G+C Gram-positive bacteria)]|uniref:ArsA family ATPase n=1 Tax=unclassified Rhodococcus (in: high G+C Gram-positive bacteria) TaxID=192944 RepID=UPI0029553D97|nr:ArsA family ATPase [Rhodococcus sp. IEGM 1343]MDV8054402.1 ArsA family ATPase [Rhodococcus sp. IEGM 1343]